MVALPLLRRKTDAEQVAQPAVVRTSTAVAVFPTARMDMYVTNNRPGHPWSAGLWGPLWQYYSGDTTAMEAGFQCLKQLGVQRPSLASNCLLVSLRGVQVTCWFTTGEHLLAVAGDDHFRRLQRQQLERELAALGMDEAELELRGLTDSAQPYMADADVLYRQMLAAWVY